MTAAVKEKLVFGQWEGVRMREVKKGKRQQLGETGELRSEERQETNSRKNRTKGSKDRGGPIAVPSSLSDQPY